MEYDSRVAEAFARYQAAYAKSEVERETLRTAYFKELERCEK